MPYIVKDDREKFKVIEKELEKNLINNVGELNYIVTNICLSYLKHKGLKYENLNGIAGALKCAGDEIQRRITGLYENTKININGDLKLYEEFTRNIQK